MKPRMSFGPIYEVTEATYIVKAGSTITDFQTLDQPGIKVAAVNNTTTMRGAVAHLKHAKVTGYQTYDEIFNLLKNGEIDAFALSRGQLKPWPGRFRARACWMKPSSRPITAVAVPLNHPLALAYATKFMTEAKTNGLLRKAFDNNGLKDTPLRAQVEASRCNSSPQGEGAQLASEVTMSVRCLLPGRDRLQAALDDRRAGGR